MNRNLVLRALDALGLALAEHGHVWTPEERRLYEAAVLSLKTDKQTTARH